MSTLFLRTLREDPADAEVASHRLLVRGGYIRRAAPGGFTWLPLGWLVYRKVERIVREEMDAEGFQEVHFPALLPREPYELSNRWTDYGDNLFRLKDRRGNDFLLAPTHEEMFTLLVKDLYSSYKDLPLVIYQIQTKYRDEARPRAGLFRGREFVMKDSYSFDVDDEGLARSYQRHRDAYIRTFERLGLPFVIVSAMSGAMGGSASEEFLAPMDIGEDTFVRTASGSYAANAEAVVTPVPDALAFDDAPPAVVHDTPDTPTIATLVDRLNADPALAHPDGRPWTAADTLKNVIVMLRHPDGTRAPLAVGVPGDRDVDPKRLEANVAPAEVEPFGEAEFAAFPQLAKGYIGPGVLGETSPPASAILLDPRIVSGHPLGHRCRPTGPSRGRAGLWSRLRGRRCDRSGRGARRAIRRPTASRWSWPGASRSATSSSSAGSTPRRSVSRCSMPTASRSRSRWAATASASAVPWPRSPRPTATSSGLVWPAEVAPAHVHVVIAGKPGGPMWPAAEQLATDLEAAGLDVLLDDRTTVSPGVKFKDAELLGIPTIVVVGRGVDDHGGGTVEVKDRRSGEREDVALDALVAHLLG